MQIIKPPDELVKVQRNPDSGNYLLNSPSHLHPQDSTQMSDCWIVEFIDKFYLTSN